MSQNDFTHGSGDTLKGFIDDLYAWKSKSVDVVDSKPDTT